MRRCAAVAAILCLGTACATLAGRHQIVSVDSSPRGVSVFSGEEELGRTPFFLKARRDRKMHVTFRPPQGAPVESVSTCRVRWGAFALGNLPLALISAPTTGVWFAGGLAVDWLTGAMFECPDRVHAALSAPVPLRLCRRFLVLPVPDDDERVSDRLAEEWRLAFADKLGECDAFVSAETAEDAFLKFGISPWTDNSPERIRPDRLSQLGFDTEATHAVFVRPFLVQGRLSLQARILDLHDGTLVRAAPVNVAGETNPSRSWWSRKLARSVGVVPNAFGLQFSQVPSLNISSAAPDFRLLDRTSHSLVPSLVSNLDLFRVQDPRQWDAWDIVPDLFFSAHMMYLSQELEYLAFGRRERESVQAFVLHFPFMGLLTLHTPLGALGLGAGAGPAWRFSASSSNGDTSGLLFGVRVPIRYTAFLSSRVFLQLGATLVWLNAPMIRSRAIHDTGWSELGVGMGLYLPETRRWLRGL